MGLVEFQAALAKLYTSSDARAALRSDRQRFADEHHLSNAEAEQLAGPVLKEADDFARSLARKRFSEVMKAMPNLEELFEMGIGGLFARYAAVTPLGSQRNPALDALSFIQWLLRGESIKLSVTNRDALRYEEGRILMQQTGRQLLIRWLLVPGRERAWHSLAIWWRWRGRLQHWVIRAF
jgi:hypothetical protein